ncbi:FG-GAP repeat domain-containing protein [Luteimonas marina]|nr:VCBS repeat-containing protein [Luteimonas marina]
MERDVTERIAERRRCVLPSQPVRPAARIRRFAGFLLAGCVVTISGTAAGSDFRFQPVALHDENLPATADTVAIADVTGDGRKDVVLVVRDWFGSIEGSQALVYAQTPSGGLAAPASHDYLGTTEGYGTELQIADLDNDGIADIVIGHDQGFTILLPRRGAGMATRLVEMPGTIVSLVAGDLDRDGRPDVVRQADGRLVVLFGNGDGTFSRSTELAIRSGGRPGGARIGDVTGDGHADIVVADQLGIVIFPGRGDGGFAAAVHYDYESYATGDSRGFRTLTLVDINRDGRLDVLTTVASNQPRSALWIFHQGQDGRLSTPQTMWTYDMAVAATAVDLDNNGYQDLLVAHGGWEALGYYLQIREGLEAERGTPLPYATTYQHHGLDGGDIDGDGCSDAAVADYNNGLLLLRGQGCLEPWAPANDVASDFDGDGRTDILWHDASTGASAIWKGGSIATQIAVTRVTDRRWRLVGRGDFDGDGRTDLFWRHVATGANAIWPGGDYRQSVSLTAVTDTRWEVVGIGDFDSDRKDDVLWRHSVNGANAIWGAGSYRNSRVLATVPDRDWLVAGIGDFNGDGRADILWRHRFSGANTIWSGGEAGTRLAVAHAPHAGWQVAGIGDVDRDGRSDIVWRHALTGRASIWPSANLNVSRDITGVADLGWKIAGIADYDHDGRADLLWRHGRSGRNVVWRAGQPNSRYELTTVTNLNWMLAR